MGFGINVRAALIVATTLVILFPLSSSSSEERIEIFGVKILRNPPQSKLNELAVTSWKLFLSGPGEFPYTFSTREIMYFVEGKLKVFCEGFDGSFEIGAGDLVVFPKGMKVIWDITQAVKKHYRPDE